MAAAIDPEILKKVEQIRILARHSVTSVFAGEFESAFRGQGLEFEEVREYTPGDEIRSIDWNVTARTGHPHVKRFREERELAIYFLVDVSPSGDFGTKGRSRNEKAAEIVSVLSISASMNNDRTSLILFSDKVEKFIPPSKGMGHTLRMVRELLAHKSEGAGTSIVSALDYLGQVAPRKSIVFLLSDFYDDSWEKTFSITARKHETICFHLYDEMERSLPPIGLIDFFDQETGENVTIDSSDRRVRRRYESQFASRLDAEEIRIRKYGSDYLSINTSRDYIHPLSMFLIKRSSAR